MKKLLHSIVLFGSLLIPAGVHAVDHSLYDDVLNEYVEGGYFDYESFMNDKQSRIKLQKYLKTMSKVSPQTLSRDEELAFWINLYNAATIRLIDKNYPVSGIKETGGWVTGPWDISFIEVNDRTLTLNQIEHEIIRPKFNEPRIHFALVCAAKSCPPLRYEVYLASRLDEQLNAQANEFIKSDKNRFEIQNGKAQLKLSSIFSWYGEDFGGEKGVARYVSKFLPGKLRKAIKNGNYTLSYIEYDWSLNQAPGPYQEPDR